MLFFSRQFGFLKLNAPENAAKKTLVVKAVKYLERMLIQAQEEKEDVDSLENKEINIDPKTYCKLGHFNLLLEEYSKGKLESLCYLHCLVFLLSCSSVGLQEISSISTR